MMASRALVGFTEAPILTRCRTLLADYFHGRQRGDRWALPAVTAETVWAVTADRLRQLSAAGSVPLPM
jgi:hypothetical protein